MTDKNTRAIKDLQKKPYNKVCFDCGQKVGHMPGPPITHLPQRILWGAFFFFAGCKGDDGDDVDDGDDGDGDNGGIAIQTCVTIMTRTKEGSIPSKTIMVTQPY